VADRRAGRGQAAALVATLVIGAVAGLYPAIRAARLCSTEALAKSAGRDSEPIEGVDSVYGWW
jgi:hypothetical protein